MFSYSHWNHHADLTPHLAQCDMLHWWIQVKRNASHVELKLFITFQKEIWLTDFDKWWSFHCFHFLPRIHFHLFIVSWLLSSLVPKNRLSTLLFFGLSSLWHTQSDVLWLVKENKSNPKKQLATILCTDTHFFLLSLHNITDKCQTILDFHGESILIHHLLKDLTLPKLLHWYISSYQGISFQISCVSI